jgi:hypothetical protein
MFQHVPVHQNTVGFETFLTVFPKSLDHNVLWCYLPSNIYVPLHRVLKNDSSLLYDTSNCEAIGLYEVFFTFQPISQMFFESLVEEA